MVETYKIHVIFNRPQNDSFVFQNKRIDNEIYMRSYTQYKMNISSLIFIYSFKAANVLTISSMSSRGSKL